MMNDMVKRMIEEKGKMSETDMENSYLDESTGLLMCSKCHTKKQTRVSFLGTEMVVGCVCKCRAEELEKEKKRMEEQENLLRIQHMRSAGLQDRAFYNYTFDKCDREQKNIRYARRYVECFEEMQKSGQGLLFWGNVGTGKTFLAGCIANALLEQRVPVLMTSFPKILNALGGLYSDERNAYLQSFNQYKLLIIDDLGIERESQYTLETVYTVIDERYKSGFPFIITTNIELSAIRNPKDIEHARIYDRILEKCMPVVFSGKNYRKERGQENSRTATQILEGEQNE